MSEATETALVPLEGDRQAALRHALRLWAEASTAPSTKRREGLQGYKQKVVSSFFSFAAKRPGEISALDVEGWRDWLGRAQRATWRAGAIGSDARSLAAWASRPTPSMPAFASSPPSSSGP